MSKWEQWTQSHKEGRHRQWVAEEADKAAMLCIRGRDREEETTKIRIRRRTIQSLRRRLRCQVLIIGLSYRQFSMVHSSTKRMITLVSLMVQARMGQQQEVHRSQMAQGKCHQGLLMRQAKAAWASIQETMVRDHKYILETTKHSWWTWRQVASDQLEATTCDINLNLPSKQSKTYKHGWTWRSRTVDIQVGHIRQYKQEALEEHTHRLSIPKIQWLATTDNTNIQSELQLLEWDQQKWPITRPTLAAITLVLAHNKYTSQSTAKTWTTHGEQ